MKNILLPLTALLAVHAALADTDTALPNPSFEKTTENRPKGWRVFLTPPEAEGAFFVADGQEGKDTHTGAAAIQISFPNGADVAQATWMADPIYGGMAVEPGRYSCSFWIQAEDLQPGFHAWVVITAYAENNSRISELGRSGYLTAKELTADGWANIRFSFEVPADQSVTRIAPSLVFKTAPDSSINPVPGSMRIRVDDLEIQKD